MAVILIEGFDHLAAADITKKGWSVSSAVTMGAGRFDGQATTLGAANQTAQKVLPSTYATAIAGVAFKPVTVGSANYQFLRFLTAAGAVVGAVRLNASGKIEVINSGATVIATGTTTLVVSTWYYIEFKLFENGASGTCEIKLNGVSEIASTTGNFGSTTIGQVQLISVVGGSVFDDLYVLDTTGASPRNTFLGDVRVETIYPNADGAHSQWTPNTGTTHYTQVNEAQADGDASYVSDATPNDLDTYAFGDIDVGATVYGVQTNLYARKDDANTRQIAPVVRQSGSDNVGTTVTMATTYVDYTQLYNQDPSSADWTPTSVNAAEFGVKEIA